LVGIIHVQDRTLLEVTAMITDSLTNILSQPIITVKLVNRYVSVIGEVKNAGHFAYSQEKLSIFDAISLAGDITEYGDKENIILTRNENGKNTRQELNLTESNILSSQFYYLRPGDLVYVRPLKKKFWGMRQFPYSILLSTISTALLIYTVVK
jgi:polysaccharide biosynthesis/export protein